MGWERWRLIPSPERVRFERTGATVLELLMLGLPRICGLETYLRSCSMEWRAPSAHSIEDALCLSVTLALRRSSKVVLRTARPLHFSCNDSTYLFRFEIRICTSSSRPWLIFQNTGPHTGIS